MGTEFMNRLPRIFATLDGLNAANQYAKKNQDNWKLYKDLAFALDPIDIPYTFVYSPAVEGIKELVYGLRYSNDKDPVASMFLFRRYVDGTDFEDIRANIVVSINDNDRKTSTMCWDNAIASNLSSLYADLIGINRYLQDKNLYDQYRKLDPVKHGLLLDAEDDEIKISVVSGKDRPEMQCINNTGLFSFDLKKCRPYADEMTGANADRDASVIGRMKAAESGDTASIEALAMSYLNGTDGVMQDPEKLAYWFRKLADAGDSNSMFNLGLFYAKGFGVEHDFKKVAEWMKKAAEVSDEDAEPIAAEFGEMDDLLSNAEAGDAEAQAELSEELMRLGGSLEQAGSDNDYKESLKWAKKSAEHNYAAAMWPLVLAHDHGRGVRHIIAKAVEYYQNGSDLGNAACQHSLGCFYASGEYLKQDDKKAFELFQKSAEKGYVLAMKDLGRCYQFGTG